MNHSFSVFTTTNSGRLVAGKDLFGSQASAQRYADAHDKDQRKDPIYTPEGSITHLKYPNGLFIVECRGMIQIRKVKGVNGHHWNEEVYPFETDVQAFDRLSHTKEVVILY